MYAEVKDFALESVEVQLNHRRIYAKDCEDCEKKAGMLDEIEARISLTGDLSQAQQQRLLEIAKRCPVHRTLAGEVKIQTSQI